MELVLLLILIFGLAPRTAHAYLDPGAGSLAIQLVLGFAAGVVMLLRVFWRRVIAYLSTLLGQRKVH